jgi:hypothetical protein
MKLLKQLGFNVIESIQFLHFVNIAYFITKL